MQRLFKNCLWLFAALFLISCDGGKQEYKIIHAKVGGHDLYIPHAYIRFGYTSVGNESGLIQAYYPGSAPVLEDPDKLWKQGKWVKNVTILFTDLKKYPDFGIEKTLNMSIDHFKASKIVGEQYKLIYQTQPDDIKNDRDELWIQKNKGMVVSFIRCGKKYTEDIVPQCTHIFSDGTFFYHINYNKGLLPEWALIRANVMALMNSFRAENSARTFLIDQTLETYPDQMEEHNGKY